MALNLTMETSEKLVKTISRTDKTAAKNAGLEKLEEKLMAAARKSLKEMRRTQDQGLVTFHLMQVRQLYQYLSSFVQDESDA